MDTQSLILGIAIGMFSTGFLICIIGMLKDFFDKRREIKRKEEEEFKSTVKLILSMPMSRSESNLSEEPKSPYKMDDDSSTEW